MKKLILTIATFTALNVSGQVIEDANGNFFAPAKASQATHDSTTTRTYTDAKGNVEPVYQGKKGAFYVARISKAGNYYRKYLQTNTATLGTHERKAVPM